MRTEYIVGIIILILVGGGALFLFSGNNPSSNTDGSYQIQQYIEIVNPSGFVNTDAITIGELVGKKVILVDFLTYSCINCQRTFPYLNAWYDTYKNDGLEIIGIHTPEFAFERDIDNVRAAMEEFGVEYPIVLDNDYATWGAYGNRFWPRKYLIDIEGNIVYDHIGEGAYEETEAKIQELLAERAVALGESVTFDDMVATVMPPAQNEARSPETYFGSERNEYLGNGMIGMSGPEAFVLPEVFTKNKLYLGGDWTIAQEYAESSSGSRVVYRYEAKNVFVVADANQPTEVEVYQDGILVNTFTVRESRLYNVVQDEVAGGHLLELRIKGKIKLYAFTFG